MSMDLQQYLSKLVLLHLEYLDNLPSDYYHCVVRPWFLEIAPRKAEEYGIGCWQRMGPLALLADVSACFYRWDRLRELGSSFEYPAMRNALRDAFGYSVMLRVMIEDGGGLHREYNDAVWSSVRSRVEPRIENEFMLCSYWEPFAKGNNEDIHAPWEELPVAAVRSAYNMFRMTKP